MNIKVALKPQSVITEQGGTETSISDHRTRWHWNLNQWSQNRDQQLKKAYLQHFYDLSHRAVTPLHIAIPYAQTHTDQPTQMVYRLIKTPNNIIIPYG